jgi:hypothetical protein
VPDPSIMSSSYRLAKKLSGPHSQYEPKGKEELRMSSSGMLCCVALVRTDVSEEPSVSFNRVTRIVELGTTHASVASYG